MSFRFPEMNLHFLNSFFDMASTLGKVSLFVYIQKSLPASWAKVRKVYKDRKWFQGRFEFFLLYIFVYNLGAQTMLGTVIQLHNLAAVYNCT